MKRILLILTIVFGLHAVSSAQTLKAFMEAATEAAEKNDYYSALTYYDYALQFDEDDMDIKMKVADAARNFNAYTTALDHYKAIAEADEDGMYPNAQFYLAQMLQRTGKYSESKQEYQNYISQFGGDDTFLTEKAKKEIEACTWAMSDVEDRSEEYAMNHLGDNVNTEYSEFGAIQKDDVLYYSSLAFEPKDDGLKRKTIAPKKNISKILVSENQSEGEELSEEVNTEELLTAHTSFNADQTQMYYTICEYLNAEDIRCDIYVRGVNEDGSYTEAQKLPDYINQSGTTSTQPAVGMKDGKEVLYFVSDREGGSGMLDIWYTEVNNGNYGQPVNLTEINTAEDDITPYYENSEKRLYFSSTGYIGLGGFDVFSVDETEDGFTSPEHLGTPVNSSYNDIYYTYNDETRKGHLSSNRIGSKYLEESHEACCYDVYAFEFTPLTTRLIVHTLERISQDSLPGTSVKLINARTGEELAAQLDEEKSTYVFEIERGEEYKLVGEKTGYESDETTFNTNDIKADEPVIKKLFLRSDELELNVFTFNEETKAELHKTTVDLICTMNGVSDTMRNINLTGNDHRFKIMRGNDYLLIGNRPGFTTATLTISADELENVEKSLSRDLFLGLQDLNALLPIVVYFDNDHPDPDVWNYSTNKKYSETYPPYMAKKQEFINIYSAPLTGSEKSEAESKVSNFFENEVKLGNLDLELFLKLLKVELDRSESVEVYLSGFTSPRYTSAYNYRLGTRRIRSVRNELKAFKSNMYEPFIDDGRLTVKLKSFGEAEAPKGIVSDLDDERNSIYSVEASRERRTEISEIKVDKGSN